MDHIIFDEFFYALDPAFPYSAFNGISIHLPQFENSNSLIDNSKVEVRENNQTIYQGIDSGSIEHLDLAKAAHIFLFS